MGDCAGILRYVQGGTCAYFFQGYREKSHICCIIALEELFVKQLGWANINNIRQAKVLREKADYDFSFSEFGAKDTIENAGEFIKKATYILKLKK